MVSYDRQVMKERTVGTFLRTINSSQKFASFLFRCQIAPFLATSSNVWR